eukprot:553283-Hanusia_phi.AAC.1
MTSAARPAQRREGVGAGYRDGHPDAAARGPTVTDGTQAPRRGPVLLRRFNRRRVRSTSVRPVPCAGHRRRFDAAAAAECSAVGGRAGHPVTLMITPGDRQPGSLY